jgi:hypothetical protein
MRLYLINAAGLDELKHRFDDDVDNYPQSLADPSRVSAEPAHQVAIANRQECSLAEWEALVTATRRQILARLDQWKAEEDAKREAILTACILAGRGSARLKGLNET